MIIAKINDVQNHNTAGGGWGDMILEMGGQEER